MGLRIRLLGPMTIEIDGRLVAVASKKARALLGYLTLREGAEVSRGVLTGLLWGERSEGQARGSLRQTLSELRAALGSASQSIMASKEIVAWAAGSAWIDAKVMETAAGCTDDDALREAAELIGGELMEGLSVGEAGFEQWLATERERFRLLAGKIHARLMERAEQDGRFEEALTHGLKLLSLDPLQEHVHRQLMRLYAVQGRHDAALAQYERCRRELSNQLDVLPEAETEDLARSIRATRREGPAKPKGSPSPTPEPERGRWPMLSLPDKPSIAVLPFANLSGDPEQQYFTDGIVADIITALSRVRSFFVIAGNSSFTYKGRTHDLKQIGRALGVRYLLEGTVRRSSTRLRITAQLVDSETGAHLWADKYDSPIEEVFDLQDHITASVVGAIEPPLTRAEMDRIERKPPESLVAYDFLLKSLQAFSVVTRESDALALRLARRAVELDERYALAHSHIAICLGRRKHTGWMSDEEAETAECVRSAHLAVQLDWDDPNVLTYAAFGLTCLNGDTDTTIPWLDRAIVLNPNSALAYGLGAVARNFAGDYSTAERHAALAMRLSPFDPWTVTFTLELGLSHLLRRNPAEAVAWLRRSAQEPSCGPSTHYSLASACAHVGWLADARVSVERLLQISPATTIEGQRRRDLALFKRAEDVEFILEGARKAGLPE